MITSKSGNLAEFVGLMLGDGNLYSQVSTGNYQIRIAFNLKEEYEYLFYVKNLALNLFNLSFYEKITKKENVVHLCKSSKKLLKFLISIGINKNKKIPNWIFKNKKYLKCCVRGLIDTDGSVFRMSNKDYRLIRIGFKNVNKKLLKNFRTALIKLDFYPSKIICNRQIFLSRKDEIKRYVKEIGFNNPKNKKRFINLALSSSGQECLLNF